MKIFVLGNKGMLGRYVESYFNHKGYNVIGLSRKAIDITHMKEHEIDERLFVFDIKRGDIIINCIGMIKQRSDVNVTDFIYVNSMFPHLLANVCEKRGFKLIHPTTDCVYNGLLGKYTEIVLHNATDVYGKSKSLGEPKNATVIRTSIIGEEIGQSRSLVEWIKSNRGGEVNGYTNHFWNGVTCLQFAKICEDIIKNNLFWDGVKHVHSDTVSKYELVNMVSDIYDLGIKVKPFETTLKCDRSLSSMYNKMFNIPPLKKQIGEMKDFYEILKNNE